MPNQKSADAALAAGRLAYQRNAWSEDYESLTAAEQQLLADAERFALRSRAA